MNDQGAVASKADDDHPTWSQVLKTVALFAGLLLVALLAGAVTGLGDLLAHQATGI